MELIPGKIYQAKRKIFAGFINDISTIQKEEIVFVTKMFGCSGDWDTYQCVHNHSLKQIYIYKPNIQDLFEQLQ